MPCLVPVMHRLALSLPYNAFASARWGTHAIGTACTNIYREIFARIRQAVGGTSTTIMVLNFRLANKAKRKSTTHSIYDKSIVREKFVAYARLANSSYWRCATACLEVLRTHAQTRESQLNSQ